jgi:NTE family protein
MQRKKINLALQGGGAHGAYTWGVLDRLLEEEDLEIEGISGTSAGAMNAAILVHGYDKGNRQGAKDALHAFWKRISEISAFGPFQASAVEQQFNHGNLNWSPAYYYMDILSRLMSPYALNPLNINPLRYVLQDMINFETLQEHHDIKLFVAATHVASGQARVFHCNEISLEVLLASACLPFMFQAIEIDGEYYWDGGYMGNPAIWPLIYNCDCEDIMLVQINPIHREELPKSAGEIINRLNEISFNSSLIAEMRAIGFVKKLLQQKRLPQDDYKDMKIHLIYSPEELKELNASSKMNAGWQFLKHLHTIGYRATEAWLKENKHAISVRSTVDIDEKFLGGPTHRPADGSLGKRKKKHKQQHEAAGPED